MKNCKDYTDCIFYKTDETDYDITNGHSSYREYCTKTGEDKRIIGFINCKKCSQDVSNLEYIKNKKEEELKEKARLAKAKAEKKYYENHFEEIVYSKIRNGELLTKEESERLVCGDSRAEIVRAEIVEENKDPDINRWTQNVETIIKLRDKYFAFRWQLDLTQYQENSYDLEPVEVFPNTYEKTIAVTEWLPV